MAGCAVTTSDGKVWVNAFTVPVSPTDKSHTRTAIVEIHKSTFGMIQLTRTELLIALDALDTAEVTRTREVHANLPKRDD